MKLFKLTILFIFLTICQVATAKDTIELVVVTPPGGAVDMTARALSKALSDKGIENTVIYHPGANGDIALSKVLSNKDKSILIASAATFVFSNVAANRENIYTKDLELIGPSVTNSMAFFAPSDKSIKSFKELIEKARKKDFPCATSNSHGEVQLTEMNKRFGTKFSNVPYKGTGQLIPDLVGGHVDCAYDQIAPYVSLQDKILMLATSSQHPYKSGIPVIQNEFSGYKFETWYAVGIEKNSKLLKDQTFIETIKNWNKNKELINPMLERSFVTTEYDSKLNQRANIETTYYQNILK